MLERLCPRCQAENSIEAHRCGGCGADLQEQLPALRKNHWLAPIRRLSPSLRRTAQPIALGLAAVAIEVGAALLQRRQAAGDQPPPAGRQLKPAQPGRLKTTIGQRVWEEYSQDGRLRRRIIEQFITRGEE